MDNNSAQQDRRYTIDVAGDGRITLSLDSEVGLSQDFFLEVFMDLQKLRAQQLAQRRLDAAKPEPAKPHWWPASVRCPHCGRKTKLDQEPASYAIFCPSCTLVIIIEPITSANL